jgi:hypothetical protein
MEKRLNKKIEVYVSQFKLEIRDKIMELGFEEKEKINDLMEFVYEYNRLTLEKEDFSKRKRVKNTVPTINRCTAKRANGEQCTRRRRDDSIYCGTHFKSAPHGYIGNDEDDMDHDDHLDTDLDATDSTGDAKTEPDVHANASFHGKIRPLLEVVAEEIHGIVYYLDKYGNVYATEDILQGKHNPAIVAKYAKVDNRYTIPSLGLC